MLITQRRAVVFRAYPTRQQAHQINRTIGCARLIYNLMLESRNAYYQSKFGNPAIVDKEVLPLPTMYKQDYPFLKEVDALALCNAQQHLRSAYNNFFTNPKAGAPKYKAKHRDRQTYTTNCIDNNIRFENGGTYLTLPKVGAVRVRQHKAIPPDWRLKNVTVEHTSSGRYTVSVAFEYETQAPDPITPVHPVGLDYSSPSFYMDSDGRPADYPQFFRKMEDRLAREQRKWSHMVKGSNNWVKQKRKVAQIHERIRNMRKDWLHKKANEIVRQYDLVCVEDIDLRAMSQTLTLGKSTMDNGFGMFRVMLAYKLAEQGKQLVKVSRWYPSSQLCSVCGYQNAEVKDMDVRQWDCPQCNTHHERDMNAAINIRNEGMRLTVG